jgi:hypothetical protein
MLPTLFSIFVSVMMGVWCIDVLRHAWKKLPSRNEPPNNEYRFMSFAFVLSLGLLCALYATLNLVALFAPPPSAFRDFIIGNNRYGLVPVGAINAMGAMRELVFRSRRRSGWIAPTIRDLIYTVGVIVLAVLFPVAYVLQGA